MKTRHAPRDNVSEIELGLKKYFWSGCCGILQPEYGQVRKMRRIDMRQARYFDRLLAAEAQRRRETASGGDMLTLEVQEVIARSLRSVQSRLTLIFASPRDMRQRST